MHHPTDRITHTTAFVTPVVEHWLEREIAQWVHHKGSIRPITPSTNALITELHLAPRVHKKSNRQDERRVVKGEWMGWIRRAKGGKRGVDGVDQTSEGC